MFVPADVARTYLIVIGTDGYKLISVIFLDFGIISVWITDHHLYLFLYCDYCSNKQNGRRSKTQWWIYSGIKTWNETAEYLDTVSCHKLLYQDRYFLALMRISLRCVKLLGMSARLGIVLWRNFSIDYGRCSH